MKRTKIPPWAFALLLGAIMVAFMRPGMANATTSEEIGSQIDTLEEEGAKLEEQIAELEEQINQNTTNLADMIERKGAIDEQIVLLYDHIQNTNDQIQAYNTLIADKQAELDEAQEKLDTLRAESQLRIREMEERGSMSYWTVLFEANTFSDFLDRLSIVQELQEADERRIQELADAAAVVRTAKQELDTEKTALETLRTELDTQQAELEEKRLLADEALQQLVESGEAYTDLLIESEERQEQLMHELAEMENEYDRLAYEEWLATSVPGTTEPETVPETLPPETQPEEIPTEPSETQPSETDPPESVPEKIPTDPPETEPPEQEQPEETVVTWLTPVPYYTLSSPFGMRLHPILGIYRMHNGIDMSCATGTPIYATRSGIVSYTDYEEDGAGYYVQINHGDGYKSIYMHMTHYIVSMGDRVETGQIIGYVGSTGLSDGPHLHFGISYNGTYVNPVEYIG